MKVGITGHQERPGIDWAWTARVLRRALEALPPPLVGLSSLARGADQLFAQMVLKLGGELIFIRPTADYASHFTDADAADYAALVAQAAREVAMPAAADDQSSFLAAGLRMVEESELVVAVWDGAKAAGKGGTGDVVAAARCGGKPVLHLDPIARTICKLGKIEIEIGPDWT